MGIVLHIPANALMLCLITPELAVLESLRCPSCSTHYGLRPERVRIGIRRARCFQCQHLFEIQDSVERLLALSAGPSPETLAEELPGLAAGDLVGLEIQEDFFPEELGQPLEEEPNAAQADLPMSLTLGDLDEPESALENTLVDFTPPAPSEAHYASAKEAISRLLGDAPPPGPQASAFPSNRHSNPMDVEATLEALENTLGGIQPEELSQTPPPSDLGTTLRMNVDDLRAAMAKMPPPEGIDPAAQTLSIPISEMPLTPRPPAPSALPPPQPVPLTVPVAQDPNLLKLKIGDDLYENLSTDQVSTWIEQGRVLENHWVARQFSENWIEANKVPALRPVFDRIKRLRSVLPDEQPAPAPEPVKKSLFGGLFGRN